MCEVLAVAWPKPEPFGRVLPWALELERLGVAGFGWGVAWLDGDGIVRVHKHAGELADDPAGQAAVRDAASERFLFHLPRPSRLATAQLSDTQPIVLDAGGFAFAHNPLLSGLPEAR